MPGQQFTIYALIVISRSAFCRGSSAVPSDKRGSGKSRRYFFNTPATSSTNEPSVTKSGFCPTQGGVTENRQVDVTKGMLGSKKGDEIRNAVKVGAERRRNEGDEESREFDVPASNASEIFLIIDVEPGTRKIPSVLRPIAGRRRTKAEERCVSVWGGRGAEQGRGVSASALRLRAVLLSRRTIVTQVIAALAYYPRLIHKGQCLLL